MNKLIVTGLLLLLGAHAQAFQVIESGGVATQILGLVISGTAYDVTVATALSTDVIPCPANPCDAFLGDEQGAADAANVISWALNEDPNIASNTYQFPPGGATRTPGVGNSPGNGSPVVDDVGPLARGQVLVPWLYDDSSCFNAPGENGTCAENGVNIGFPGTWFYVGTAEIPTLPAVLVDFARFAPAAVVVPLPAAAWLFGSALGLLGWVARKRAPGLKNLSG